MPFLPEVGQRVLPIIDSLPDGNQVCISDNDPAGKATFLEQRRIIEGIVDTLKNTERQLADNDIPEEKLKDIENKSLVGIGELIRSVGVLATAYSRSKQWLDNLI